MNMKPIKEKVEAAGTETFSSRIMSRIEGEGISPCPRWQFFCLHCSVWLLWALSVTAGAIAVAVMMYVGNHARFALFEATHTTPLSFFVEVLPYIWIGVFTLMALFAYFNLRHTKRGYRYRVLHILLSSIMFSILGGIVLHAFGVGHLIDRSLSQGMPLYPSLERIEMKLWQNPHEGRLVGHFVGVGADAMHYNFVDTKDRTWSIVVTELRESDRILFESENSVRLLGTTTDMLNRQFHACGIFPWMFNARDLPTKELLKQREVFISRMYEHMEVDDQIKAFEKQTYPDRPLAEPVFMEGLCADIAAVKRVQFNKEAI